MCHLLKIMNHRLFQHFNNIFFYISFIYFVSSIYVQPLLKYYLFHFINSFHLIHFEVIKFLCYLHHQVYILYFRYLVHPFRLFHSFHFTYSFNPFHFGCRFQCPSQMFIIFMLKVIHFLMIINHRASY